MEVLFDPGFPIPPAGIRLGFCEGRPVKIAFAVIQLQFCSILLDPTEQSVEFIKHNPIQDSSDTKLYFEIARVMPEQVWSPISIRPFIGPVTLSMLRS